MSVERWHLTGQRVPRIRIIFRTACVLVLTAVAAVGCTAESETKTYKVYFLGGQSNMVGYGNVEKLPHELDRGIDRVMIFAGRSAFDGEIDGGEGVWAPLTPGFGYGFSTDGRSVSLSDLFGPELSFGATLSSAKPDSSIAIVKYTLGGSGLESGVGYGSWHPTDKDGHGLNQFDHAIRTLHNAFSERDIDGDGIRDRLVPAGIIWMQGESDANENQAIAEAYEENLTFFVESLRIAFRDDDLPIVIGKITDSGMADDGSVMDHIESVQLGQAAFVSADRCADLVTVTEGLNYRDDAWHYDTEGFILLGEAFADSILRLEENCGRQKLGLLDD